MNYIPLTDALTEREVEILRLIACGMSNQEIAFQITIAPETVKWYNKRIYEKLHVSSRTQAVAQAQLLGLLNAESQNASPAYMLPPHNLPAQVTSFVGRQHETAQVRRLLADARLLTLTGPPGSGKTRLALQVAADALAAFKDGVYFVPLAPVTDADSILWTIAEHIAFQFHPQGKPIDQLFNYFREKTLLLVLDNFEHLLSGAEALFGILHAAPNVKILVTSRERLNLYGEVNYVIGGLTLPAASLMEDALGSESVELFVQRALCIERHLDLTPNTLHAVADICHLVEGLPLGIELAATWVDVLSLEEIAREIQCSLDILETEVRGVGHSQKSMRATFARSWDLLTEEQQAAFRRMAVFRGGFTRDAAQAVTGMTLRTLQALTHKSLLRYHPATGYYEIHELLRQYAHEQLDRSGEAMEVSETHANYFADFMAARWPQLKGHHQHIALLEIEVQIENTRAAWRYWITKKNAAKLKQFLHSLWVIYDIRGWYPAGIELFEEAVEVMREVASEEARAVLGWLLVAQGYFSAAGGIEGEQTMPLPDWVAAYGFHSSQTGQSSVPNGLALVQQGIHVLKQLDYAHADMMIIPLMSMFFIACRLGEEALVLQAAHDCLEVATRSGDEWAIAKGKQLLALDALENGDFLTAETLAHEALTVFEASGDNWSKSVLCVEVLGQLSITTQQFETAKGWIQQGLQAAQEIGFKYSIQTAYWQLGFVATLENKISEAGIYWRKALGVAGHNLGGQSAIGFGGSRSSVVWGGRKLIKD